jgi:hypothetical protein
MAVTGYFDAFPAKARTELRLATFPPGTGQIPAGTYLFYEYFCTDLSCNCQRVIIKVLNPRSEADRNPREVATFSYSWGDDRDSPFKDLDLDVPNPFLDPLHHQAPFAAELLEFWHDMVTRDLVYAKRLRTHYAELRKKLGKSDERKASFGLSELDVPMNREERRRWRKLRA